MSQNCDEILYCNRVGGIHPLLDDRLLSHAMKASFHASHSLFAQKKASHMQGFFQVYQRIIFTMESPIRIIDHATVTSISVLFDTGFVVLFPVAFTVINNPYLPFLRPFLMVSFPVFLFIEK